MIEILQQKLIVETKTQLTASYLESICIRAFLNLNKLDYVINGIFEPKKIKEITLK